jgi:asparagine synthase (glutamine-hydrolysing)
MCGLAGIVADGAIAAGLLEAMTSRLEHRGPDGAGHWYGPGIALGHRRLAILDLSDRGAQPMHCLDRYVIVHNGEVYNYLELRAELERDGYRFRSGTDTEVIVAAYDHWGAGCLSRFNGMWAFLIYDRRDGRVFVARDRFGVKPFHYATAGGSFVFASEIKALFAHPGVRREPDLDYCRRYVIYGPREYGPDTAWSGIRRLEQGCYIECALEDLRHGRFTPVRYWSLEPGGDEAYDDRRAAELAEEYLALLQAAVRLRLRADVPVGSALSGGLDSSSVVYLVNRGLRDADASGLQETFSCVYRTPGTEDCDETEYIDTVARQLGVRSNRIEPTVADVAMRHREMIYYLDTPPESSLMSSWHTFLRVSQTPVVVTLDGQGADEQLAGYPRYIVPFLAHAAAPVREARALLRMPGTRPFVGLGLLASAAGAVGAPGLVPAALRRARKQIYDGETLNAALCADAVGGLQNLIHYADRTSMAFSVESRMPFLDYRLAEFLARVPASYKIHAGWTKYLARRAFDGRLPGEIVWRRDKMGWPIPEAHWFRGTLRGWYRDSIGSSAFLRELGLEPDVDALLDRAKGVGNTTRLLNLAQWHRVHVEEAWSPRSLPSDRVRARTH